MKTTETNYEQQAADFLKKVGATIKIKFLKNDYHFEGDKDTRDIYRFTIRRNGKSYSANFGASLNDTCTGTPPTAYDILTVLTKYEVGTFEDFCSNYGYDEDSRSAERTYKAVLKEFAGVERVFGDVLEELQEIQ